MLKMINKIYHHKYNNIVKGQVNEVERIVMKIKKYKNHQQNKK
jgi:hypothetical protein